MISNVLLGIIPSNTNWVIFLTPEDSTDNNFNTALNAERTGAPQTMYATWTLPNIMLLSSTRIKVQIVTTGSPSNVIWTFEFYNGVTWTTIFTNSSTSEGIVLDIDRTDKFLNVVNASQIRFKVETQAGNTIDLVIFEAQAFNYNFTSVTQDSTDEYSLPEHNSWGVKAGLPLPKALRAWK